MPKESRSILDLMSKEDAAKAIARGKKRLEKNKARRGVDVSPEVFLVAEFGYYFGWEAMMAIRRGYIIEPDIKGGKISGEEDEAVGELTYRKSLFTLDEAMVLLEGARKKWYSNLIDESHGTMVASSAKFAKSPSDAFKNGMGQYMERATVKE